MKYLIVLAAIVTFYGCKISDISHPDYSDSVESTKKAEQLLQETINKQGFDVLKSKNLYQVEMTDHWPGLIGKMAKLWPDQLAELRVNYNYNTFDGQGVYLNGKRKGILIGVQSWHYYEKGKGKTMPELVEGGSAADKQEFGLVVLHYFIELPYRLNNAPVKRYYGTRTHNGQKYDLVFVSWGDGTANAEYDQYILWINSETKLVDYCVFTLHDNTNPLTRHKYGSIAYQDYRNEEGFMMPYKMPVLIDNGVVTESSTEKYLHQFSIKKFKYDGFAETDLYPFENIKKQGDSK